MLIRYLVVFFDYFYSEVVYAEVAQLGEALHLHVNASLSLLPNRMWRYPLVVYKTSGSTNSEMTQTDPSVISGGTLLTVDIVVQ